MTAGLTLNKITLQKGIGIGEAAHRVADLGWTPSYVQEAMTFPTDYKITKVPKDPMKQVLRSYFPMQEEKDNRVYGALDAALRGDMFRNVEPRWIEWMKLFLAIIPFPEISAARSMAMVGRLAPGEELRTGFTMQMVDEFRHSTIQMNLKKWYMENYIDPAGFDITEAAFGKCYASTIGRQFAEGFLTGDAVTAANVYLQVVAETAFTNTLFVAMPSEAARNGDYALPTVFLSVQSDESRHIGNATSNMPSGRTTPSSTPPSARSSNTAPRTATRTRNPTQNCGTAGSTRTTTGPTCCRLRNTASRSTTTTYRRRGTGWSRRTTSTRWHSSSRSAGR
jgi:propane 2-monooxygenase large subunit